MINIRTAEKVYVTIGLCVVCWLGYQYFSMKRGLREGEDEQQGHSLREAIRLAPSVTIYGKVVDTDGQPVAGAEATITVRRLEMLLKQSYHETRSAVTDTNGDFQITAEKPYDAFIQTVVKEGYLFEKDVEATLDVVNHRKSSSGSRLLFRMRKLGRPVFLLVAPMENSDPTRLLRVEAGESKSAKWSVSNLDSYHSFWSAARDLEAVARFDEEKLDWEVTFRALSPNGGLVLSQKDLFTAPEEGYQREVRFRTGGVDIRSRDTKYYLFLKTRTPMLYAKLALEQLIGLPRQYPQSDLDIAVKSWTNPYGERNFEPLKRTAENFQAQDAHTEYCLKCINENRRADPKHLTDLLEAAKSKPPTP